MAIERMKKLTLIALNEDKERILNGLLWLSAVDVSPLSAEGRGDESKLLRRDGAVAEDEEIGGRIALLESAMKLMGMNYTAKKSMFAPRQRVVKGDFADSETGEKTESAAKRALEIQTELNEVRSSANRVGQRIRTLEPWATLPTPLNRKPSKHTSQIIGIIPAKVSADELTEIEDGDSVEHIPVWAEKINEVNSFGYVTVVYLDEFEEQLKKLLSEKDFSLAVFPEFTGTAEDNITKLKEEASHLEERRIVLEKELGSLSNENYDAVKKQIDILMNKRKLVSVRSSLLMTEKAFVLEGWYPEERESELTAFAEGFACYCEFAEPEEDEEPPVKLRNKTLIEPFEPITAMYSIPTYRGLDPTFAVAPFYFILFGMMLSDAGYGILMTVACALGLKLLHPRPGMSKILKMFMFCGISTVFWGAMFGTFFGDVVGVVSSTFFGGSTEFKPLWFNPVNDPLKMLIISYIIGYAHIMLGILLNGYMLIKRKQYLSALFDVGLWLLVLLGLPLLIAGGIVAKIGIGMAIAGAVGLVLTQGRHEKNIFKKISSGILSLYGITGYAADILSYSRILALGLSTGVIGSVFNKLGSLGGSGIFSAIIFIVIFLVGHTLNIALCSLGAYVHSSRLQFIEFFSKFYESGGRAFAALGIEEKYTDISLS